MGSRGHAWRAADSFVGSQFCLHPLRIEEQLESVAWTCQTRKRFQRDAAGGLTNEQLKNAADMPREAIHKSQRRKYCAKLSYAHTGAVGAGPMAFASRVLTRKGTKGRRR